MIWDTVKMELFLIANDVFVTSLEFLEDVITVLFS